jgi:hypothetical protein
VKKKDIGIKPDKVHLNIPLYKSRIIASYYDATFRTRSYGAERAAEIYPILREHALDSMKGLFSFEEIDIMFEILNLGRIRFEISRDSVVQKIKDSIVLQPYLTVEQKELVGQILKKFEQLDFYQVIILTEWIATYNSLSETYKGKRKSMTLEEYAKRLLA